MEVNRFKPQALVHPFVLRKRFSDQDRKKRRQCQIRTGVAGWIAACADSGGFLE
jgi:hypothetical protein